MPHAPQVLQQHQRPQHLLLSTTTRWHQQQQHPPACRRRCPASVKATSSEHQQQQQHGEEQQQQHGEQQQQQQLDARQLRQLRQEAYNAGFRAGLLHGAQVHVRVTLDTPELQPQQQAQQPRQQHEPDRKTAGSRAGGDSLARSAVKGLVWRIFSTATTVSVALLVLHDSLQVSDALRFGGIEAVCKYVLYLVHERLWAAAALL